MKWVLRYLKGTTDIGLCFGGNTCRIIGFLDSDHVGDLDRCRSIVGYVFNGSQVSW